MRIVALLITPIPMLAFLAATVWCLREGHTGFAVAFTILTAYATPKISVGKSKDSAKAEDRKTEKKEAAQ